MFARHQKDICTLRFIGRSRAAAGISVVQVLPFECAVEVGRGAGLGQEPLQGSEPMLHSMGWHGSLKRLKDDVLPLFLTAPIRAGDADPTMLRGLGAAKALLRAAREQHASESLDLSHIQSLCTYDWILSQEENLEVQAWLKSIWTAAGVAGASAVQRCTQRPSSSSNEMPGGPAAKKRKSMASSCEAENVANLFA